MIGVPAHPVGQHHDARPRLPNYSCDLQPVFPCVLNAPVGNVKGLAPTYAKNFGRVVGFTGAIVGGAARAHLAFGQVEDAGPVSELSHLEQSAATSLLNIIAMGGDSENIERLIGGEGR